MTNVFTPDQVRYELEYKLGEGLNSNVWRATRFDFSGENPRSVALKLPKDQTAVSFLRREYEILQRLNSLHVVRVIAWESCGDQPALALDWIDGVTLLELSQKTSLSPAARDEIVRQIYVGLTDVAAVHAAHGDVHPGNVMVDREGRLRLIDFASGKTPEGLLQAAPAFVSPDIWAGRGFSHDSDVFALKVIRDHLADGFRSLPERTSRVRELRVAKENALARAELGREVARLLSDEPMFGTELVTPTENPKTPTFFRLAAVLVVALMLHAPVFADDPVPEAAGSAQILVTGQNWMQISINGMPAGFAPLKLTKIWAGMHHIEWSSANSHGELRLNVRAGDTVRLAEVRGRLEVR